MNGPDMIRKDRMHREGKDMGDDRVGGTVPDCSMLLHSHHQ